MKRRILIFCLSLQIFLVFLSPPLAAAKSHREETPDETASVLDASHLDLSLKISIYDQSTNPLYRLFDGKIKNKAKQLIWQWRPHAPWPNFSDAAVIKFSNYPDPVLVSLWREGAHMGSIRVFGLHASPAGEPEMLLLQNSASDVTYETFPDHLVIHLSEVAQRPNGKEGTFLEVLHYFTMNWHPTN